jgi:hypothetical protein
VVLVEVLGHVLGDDVQIDLVLVLAVSVIGLVELETVGVVQHFDDLQLTVLVVLVLEDSLNGYLLTRLEVPALI